MQNVQDLVSQRISRENLRFEAASELRVRVMRPHREQYAKYTALEPQPEVRAMCFWWLLS